MGSIKTIAIAFLISFCIIIFITNAKLRQETFDILNHRLGKSNIRFFDLVVIIISIIIILYSFEILSKAKILLKFKLILKNAKIYMI